MQSSTGCSRDLPGAEGRPEKGIPGQCCCSGVPLRNTRSHLPISKSPKETCSNAHQVCRGCQTGALSQHIAERLGSKSVRFLGQRRGLFRMALPAPRCGDSHVLAAVAPD